MYSALNVKFLSSSIKEVTKSKASPPVTPIAQVEKARVTTPLLGITLERPQNVIGPPAAAVNSIAPAGAVPIPASNMAATKGISNIKGTFISIPNDAAMSTPKISSPIQVVIVSGLIHWMTNPLAKPATTMIGPNLNKNPTVALTN